MRKPICILLISILSGCTSQTDTPQVVADAQVSPTVAAPPLIEEVIPAQVGWTPSQACSFLGNTFGVEIRPYKNDYEDEFSCSTPYKNLQEGQSLPNNLAYYVEGKRDVATVIKLVLNINEPGKQAFAKEQLKKFSRILAKAATGAELPSDISNSIMSGTSKVHETAGYRQELKRDNWPTGRGYELHYIVTKVGEG